MSDHQNLSQQIVLQTPATEVKPKHTTSDTHHDRKDILFRWTIKRVSDIDTTRQRFYCEFTLKLIWKADPEEASNCEEALQLSHKDLFDWEPNWKPLISFPNALEVELTPINIGRSPFFQVIKKNGDYTIYYDMEVRAWFMESFELRYFPFDCQDLTLIMKIGNKGGTQKYRMIPDLSEDGQTFAKIDLLYSVFSEWRQYPSILGIGFTDPKASKRGNSYPIIYCRLKVERHYEFYIKRVGVILALLSLSALCAFGIDPTNSGNRLGLVITLELAVVAFQFTVNQSLPVVSFLTYIDQYMMGVFIFIFLVAIENALVTIASDEHIKRIDDILFAIFVFIWIIIHAIILIYVPKIIQIERAKLLPENEKFEERLLSATEGGIVAHLFQKDEKEIEKIGKQEWAVFVGKPVTQGT